ncbi:MAG: PEP-CTERM sorting domain-containing protein, partial [Desulfococcaceae bacterium]
TVNLVWPWEEEEDTEEFPIATTFNFSSPSVTGEVTGESDGKWRLLKDDYGIVNWNGPAEFAWGETGLFTIELSNAKFGTPGHDIVQATFTYESAPVPEPGTVLLLGSGLLGLAVYGRKRKSFTV